MASVPDTKGASKGEAKTLESVERTVRVLRSFDAGSSLMLAEIARRAGLSEATALRYLVSLRKFGLVERSETNRYRLGWEVFRLGQLALGDRVPRETVLPVMEQLLERFEETVNLAVREGDNCVIVEVLQGTRGLKKLNEIGQHDPWHASALGKAILAFTQERSALIEHLRLQRFTEHTIVRRAALERELEAARQRGWAVDREECEEGLTCVAAPVIGPDGAPVFALSVSFLTHRLEAGQLDEQAGPTLVAAADELERRLGYRGRSGVSATAT